MSDKPRHYASIQQWRPHIGTCDIHMDTARNPKLNLEPYLKAQTCAPWILATGIDTVDAMQSPLILSVSGLCMGEV